MIQPTRRALAAVLFAIALTFAMPDTHARNSHTDLLTLFAQWRTFEIPPLLDGAPDYTAQRFAQRQEAFEHLRTQLHALDVTSWSVAQQVDWHLVRAEMNGYDFNQRVLKPWARDPAFYQSLWMEQSDVPAHEGPTHHAVIEVWQYHFPLSAADEARLAGELRSIAPLLSQARRNLTGNARDLWLTGIRNIRAQSKDLDALAKMAGNNPPPVLRDALAQAQDATESFAKWLQEQAKDKTGPSGVGRDNYTWYQRNVHLLPMTWEDEVRLLKRELNRAWASLKLEEHRNRNLPPLVAAATPKDFAALSERSATRFLNFLREQNILTYEDYFEPALRAHLFGFVPEEKRNFFVIAAHYDPTPLFTHFYHWFELARMQRAPHPSAVRQGALLYNIFDSRNEGTATGVEEMFMHAGLYDDNPRAREIVWIMLAQRAARGLGSLYAHANLMTMEEAGGVHMEFTPRGWMKTEKELLIFEQHLYLRQPGYGTSYITGKYLLEKTLADYGRLVEARGDTFRLGDFFDQLNAIDSIPITLARWEMTGLDDDIKALSRQ